MTYDWFKCYEDVAHLLRPIIPDKTARILILGCGNSTLSEDVRVSALSVYIYFRPLSEHFPYYRSDVRRRVQEYRQRRRTLVLLTIRWSLMAFSDTQYSPIVIEQMSTRNHSRPEMQCTLSSPHH